MSITTIRQRLNERRTVTIVKCEDPQTTMRTIIGENLVNIVSMQRGQGWFKAITALDSIVLTCIRVPSNYRVTNHHGPTVVDLTKEVKTKK